MDRMNIMTSCDDKLAKYIPIQIASIASNMKNYQVAFYLFHYRISRENVGLIRSFTETFENLSFFEVIIDDTEAYQELAKHGGIEWPCEAYFSLCCHEHLPPDIDRIIYIDAGDIIFYGDISEYYFHDFAGRSIITDATRFTARNGVMDIFRREDMSDTDKARKIKGGILNSGAFVMNVSQFREDELCMDDFVRLAEALRESYPDDDPLYFGDQGLISAAFVGDVTFFGFPEHKDVLYSPYNFVPVTYNLRSEIHFTPKIIHYAGGGLAKPWRARFSLEEIDKYVFKFDDQGVYAPFKMKREHVELAEIWWKYCEMTPLYDELNAEASHAARVLEKYYLPLCDSYNKLADICMELQEAMNK